MEELTKQQEDLILEREDEKDTEIKLRRGVCEGCTEESCKGCYYYNEE